MDAVLHCGINFWFETLKKSTVTAALIVDRDDRRHAHVGAERLFNSWSSWFHVADVVIADSDRQSYSFQGTDCILCAAKNLTPALIAERAWEAALENAVAREVVERIARGFPDVLVLA